MLVKPSSTKEFRAATESPMRPKEAWSLVVATASAISNSSCSVQLKQHGPTTPCALSCTVPPWAALDCTAALVVALRCAAFLLCAAELRCCTSLPQCGTSLLHCTASLLHFCTSALLHFCTSALHCFEDRLSHRPFLRLLLPLSANLIATSCEILQLFLPAKLNALNDTSCFEDYGIKTQRSLFRM
jgi:hypothetical protein